MSIWVDGLSILVSDWQLIIVILVLIFVGQSIITLPLKKIFGNNLTSLEYLSLGLAGWIAPLLLPALIGYLIGSAQMVFTFLIVLVLFFAFCLKSDSLTASGHRPKLIPALYVFAFLILRLAFVSKAIFPSYFDSAQHYWIIKNILGIERPWIFNWLTASYYHLGYHFLTAFIVSLANVEITRAMLVFGQVVLTFIPFAVYFLVAHVTKSKVAGWFAVILAAIGWYMPAHAVDWGKYPALFSLGMIFFVIDIAYLLVENKKIISFQGQWILYGLLSLGFIASVFMHSRSLITFGIVLVVWITTALWGNLHRTLKKIFFILLFIAVLLQVFVIQQHEVLKPLIDPYNNEGTLITLLVLALSFFGYRAHPQLTFACTLTICLMFICLFIPINGLIPGSDNLTLLDRPYVEMSLFLPLSLLGGAGLAGLEKTFQRSVLWRRYGGPLVIGIVIFFAVFTYDLYPSDCCMIVGNDDVVAMDWMEKQLPAESRIGISSTELIVLASNTSNGIVGADAGIWIMPLTGRVTLPLSYHYEFDQYSAMEQLCKLGVDYLFVGQYGQPFEGEKIKLHPEWYAPLLMMPFTGVYEVIGCDGV